MEKIEKIKEIVEKNKGILYVKELEEKEYLIINDRNKIDPQIFNTAMKEYTKVKNKNYCLLSKYAKKLKIYNKLQQYMEVLDWKETQWVDDITLEVKNITLIREDDDYGGYRITFEAIYNNEMPVIMKIDITTIIAEKFESIIKRAILGSRIRDYYDIHMLLNTQSKNIDEDTLK